MMTACKKTPTKDSIVNKNDSSLSEMITDTEDVEVVESHNEKCKEVILNFNNNNCNLENFISRIFYDKDIDLKRDKEFLQ